MRENFLDELNEAQREAAACVEGPVMIIAGAGSGKTRTLTYRIANILHKGTDPFRVLALTFTNKAAKEMQERIASLIGTQARNVWMGTFHSIFARILRQEAEKLGYTSNFTIYDTDDSKALIRRIVKEQNLDPKTYQVSYILYRISMAKSNLISVNEYAQNAEILAADKAAGKPLTVEIFKLYNARLKHGNAMDFDDLLYNMNVLLRDYPEVLYKYQQRFKYILVDEYQDTNYAQYLIVKKLAAITQNICVVGDDAQSIYAFRGDNIANILNVQRDYPALKTVKLDQNYRSTKNIVGAANELIQHNRDQIQKDIWTANDDGDKIQIIKASSDTEEGHKVAQTIVEYKLQYQARHKDFAILYRTNNQSRAMEDALRRLNIAYRIYGGLSFYKRKEVKDLMAYFRLAVNPYDEEALMRVINYPARGIGQTTIEKLYVLAGSIDKSVWEVLCNIRATGEVFNASTKTKLEQFAVMIQSFYTQAKTTEITQLVDFIWKHCGIRQAIVEEDTVESEARLRNIEELLNSVSEFSEREMPVYDEETGEIKEIKTTRTIDEFLQEISLMTDADNEDPDNDDKVQLMTIHAAKGLEFKYVFVVGLEENLFPSVRSLCSRAELEEERRLFYVAVTRAEKKLFLSYAMHRFMYGSGSFCEPSRFMLEINPKFIENTDNTLEISCEEKEVFTKKIFAPKQKIEQTKLKKLESIAKNQYAPKADANPEFKANAGNIPYRIGMKVRHVSFGDGEITAIEEMPPYQKLTVKFAAVGVKKLITSHAKLMILEQ